MAAKILVLQGACCSRSRNVLAQVNNGLKRLGITTVKSLEVEFTSYAYWDSPFTAIISPSPIFASCLGHVEVLPRAYMGAVNEEEFDAILIKCLKKIGVY